MKKILALVGVFLLGLSANAVDVPMDFSDMIINEGPVTMENIWKKLGKREEKINLVGSKILNANKIPNRVNFVLARGNYTLNAATYYSTKTVKIYTGLFNYIDNDDELAAILSHEIAHDMDFYDGFGKLIVMKFNSKAYEYYLLNKPKGVVTTTNDEKGRNTVIDLIETNTRIYPVGRLDYDTTGALILTNDGNLANLLMRPDSQVDKTYIAKVKGIVQIPDIQKLRNGIIIDGVKTKKASVRLKSVDKKKETSTIVLTIHEGKNHQIKKMFESLGYKVIKLRREKIAFLDLKGLMPGEYRNLSIKEVKVLYSLCKK